MRLLRDKNPAYVTDSVWKPYYDKGHDISESGAFCVNCNSYVINMAECFNIPECEGKLMTNTLITQGSITTYPPINPTFVIPAVNGESLLTIKPDGTVETDSLENACLAGKIFVESIRSRLTNHDSYTIPTQSNDEFLNKTEDLYLLSKIMDAMKDENITEAVSLIHAVRKTDRDEIERLNNSFEAYKELYP